MITTSNRRRWYQFRLRTLLIVVAVYAVVCGIMGSLLMAPILRRRAMIDRITSRDHGMAWWDVNPTLNNPIPWYRRVLGDWRIDDIDLPPDTSKDERAHIKEAIPEARLWKTAPDGRELEPFDD